VRAGRLSTLGSVAPPVSRRLAQPRGQPRQRERGEQQQGQRGPAGVAVRLELVHPAVRAEPAQPRHGVRAVAGHPDQVRQREHPRRGPHRPPAHVEQLRGDRAEAGGRGGEARQPQAEQRRATERYAVGQQHDDAGRAEQHAGADHREQLQQQDPRGAQRRREHERAAVGLLVPAGQAQHGEQRPDRSDRLEEPAAVPGDEAPRRVDVAGQPLQHPHPGVVLERGEPGPRGGVRVALLVADDLQGDVRRAGQREDGGPTAYEAGRQREHRPLRGHGSS
jgi:hypothetical protein